MHKDFKIGMLVGLVLAMAATLWLATRPSLTPAAGMPDSHSVAALPGPARSPERLQDTRPIAERPGKSPPSTTDNQRTSPDLTIYEQAEKIKTQRFHIVRKDETLSAISQKYYGSANKWRRILDANQNVIKDVHRITPGTKLIIPD
jgi:nucleoid-associated protein YgaU